MGGWMDVYVHLASCRWYIWLVNHFIILGGSVGTEGSNRWQLNSFRIQLAGESKLDSDQRCQDNKIFECILLLQRKPAQRATMHPHPNIVLRWCRLLLIVSFNWS